MPDRLVAAPVSMFARSAVVPRTALHDSGVTAVLKALRKASRRTAIVRHWSLTPPETASRQSQAPRPEPLRSMTSDPSARRATLNSLSAGDRVRHPMHVRVGPALGPGPTARPPHRPGALPNLHCQ